MPVAASDPGRLTPDAPTIFALSSGAPPAGVAVVRASGPGARDLLPLLTGRPNPDPRHAVVRRLSDPERGGELDRALVLWLPGPGTATGEDMVELHLHGGRAVVAAILTSLSRIEGYRPAQAGEFTRRALTNGIIDLVEAEALGDLLTAETEGQRRHALLMAGGALSKAVELWQAKLLAMAARIEAVLDFSDEGDVTVVADFRGEIAELAGEIEAWLERPRAERLRDGVKVVLAGPPNAGKSSLFNALIGRDAAIVTPIAGTTRDIIEAPVQLGGVAFLLIDSAGLRADDVDAVERIGIDRAKAAMDTADILLWLGEPAAAPRGDDVILIGARSDLLTPSPDVAFAVSAETGAGLDALVAHLVQRASTLLPVAGEAALNGRQAAALADVVSALRMAEQSPDLILQAEGLRGARAAFDALTGRAGTESVLDALFGAFCIGK